MSKEELAALRSEIDRVDHEIVKLLSKREDIAKEIGMTKRKDGLNVRDAQREKKVADRMISLAKALGADRDTTKQLARLLMADAVRVQKEKDGTPLEGTSALVVGGAGRMGGWMCRYLSNRGATVKVWDPKGRRTGYSNVRMLAPAAEASDTVVVASPLGASAQDLKMVLDAGPTGLVFDVCSVKSHIAGQLRQAAANGVDIASAHPMFGPKAASPNGLNVVVCDCGSKSAAERTRNLFRQGGAKVTYLYLEEHDRMMAYILGLSHLTALLFSGSLRSSDKPASELGEVQGTSFARLAELAREVSCESRRVYHDIQAMNPHTKEMVEGMERALLELKEAAVQSDHDMFKRLMDSAQEQLER